MILMVLRFFFELKVLKEILAKKINVIFDVLNYIKKIFFFMHVYNVYIILLIILKIIKIIVIVIFFKYIFLGFNFRSTIL